MTGCVLGLVIMFFRVLGLVVGLTAGQLAVALAGGHGLRSEVAALKAPRSDNGQHGDVRYVTHSPCHRSLIS